MNDGFKSGFVSLIGRPNAGKSTLLNALVGQKVAIVADKPQTTRTAIQGVVTLPEAQIVFVDTPGIHKADSQLNKRLMDTVRNELEERDLLLFLADAARKFGPEDRRAVDVARRIGTPVVLVLNKVDLLKDKAALLPLIEQYKAVYEFAEYVPVSAVKKIGLDDLRRVILERLPEGPAYFPEDYVTDQPERFLAAELIREKVLLATRQEVPHSVAVMVDKWEETPKITRIYATIRVERDGQKAIVIGTGGAMLKQIGTLARHEMEKSFGVKIYLDLHVRVEPGWREKRAFLNTLDWRTMAGEE
ncbi:MAG TPA: GTPase Era [Candidatus Acidoferrales bacterium]|jgi:GTP-binding protein Era|nr:GTPase Era [Candidatus Acidoferrales bacterium]